MRQRTRTRLSESRTTRATDFADPFEILPRDMATDARTSDAKRWAGVGLYVPVKVDEIVNGPYHGNGHDDDPHRVYDVALHGSVDEDAIADQVVVVEVSPG